MNARYFRTAMSNLIKNPSISCASPDIDQGNLSVIQYLHSLFESLGFRCEVQPVDHQNEKYNLVATLGEGAGGLVLAGHSDTVPYDQGRWQFDPFDMTEQDNRFYGLGSCDMKGFFAVIATALKEMDLSLLDARVVIIATADEESSMSGARALAVQGHRYGRVAVIGEPTELQPVRMHKGIMMEKIRVTGRSGHSSNPELGISALEAMHLVISDLQVFRAELQERWKNPAFAVEYPTMNFGHIHGGDNPNRICGQCELHFDLRPLPGMNLDELKNMIVSRLQPLEEKTGARICLESLFAGVPSFETPESAEIVRLCESMTGTRSISVPFATEAPFLQELGMDTVVLGPGSINQAHQPNEFLSYDQVTRAVEVVKNLVGHYCLSSR